MSMPREESCRRLCAQGMLFALTCAVTGALLGFSLAVPAQAADFTVGEIRRINKETKRITLRHGEIKSLEMPAMTMAFGVRDPKMLEDLKVGDKVRFQAIKDPNGELIVTSIRPLP
jgi:Cu(I)/Ag(I) efflux system protein CusF